MPSLIKYLLACFDVLLSEPCVFLLLFADEIYCLFMEIRQNMLLGIAFYAQFVYTRHLGGN